MRQNLCVGFAFSMMLVIVSGCSGGAVEAGSSGSLQVKTTELAADDACPNGGVTIEMGFDRNGNKILDAEEVVKTEVVCNGMNGSQGDKGEPGADGKNIVTRTTSESSGENCANSGVKFETGIDDDGNETLEDGEVDLTVFVCNGADGQGVQATLEEPGLNCPNGGVRLDVNVGAPTYICNGTPGATGQAGESVVMTSEDAGDNCTYGGQKLQVGDGTPTYVCNGASGATGQAGESVVMTPEEAGDNCTYGGQKLQVGEGTPTYVCNGTPGATGQAGESVVMTPEDAGDNCTYAGVMLQVGDGTPTYVCNGASGAAGQNGQSVAVTPENEGDNCTYGGAMLQVEDGTPTYVCNGAPGIAGQDGQSVVMTPEDEGDNCTYGGVMLQVEDGTPTYVCNGVPGATGQDGQSVVVTPDNTTCTYGGVMLQVGEGTPTYVCNGEPGATGQNGQSVVMTPDSTICTYGGVKLQVGEGTPTYVCNGASGTPGLEGTSVTMTPEDPGAHCVLGGVKLQVGSGPATYLCNGAIPGVSVVTVSVTDISYTSSLVNAANTNITNDGNEVVLTRGVCLSLNPAPDLTDTVYLAGPGSGSFTTTCNQLLSNTTYYVRAFQTTTVGTTYGNELYFRTKALTVPTITTQVISNITNATAISGGNITDDGGTPILTRGICWSLDSNPTTEDNIVTEGVGVGSYIALMTALTPNTPYYVKAYATNAQGTSYGDERSFTTITLPLASVTTTAASSISFATAMSGGNVTSDNGESVTSRGICWATTPSPTTANSKYTEAGGLGSFTADMTGLIPDTTYYVRAFAVNGGGTSYGNEVSFATPIPSTPSLTTKPVSGISFNIAGSGGVISTDGGFAITAKGVCWSLNPTPTLDNSCSTDGTGAASYNSTMIGLNPLTSYYVRAYATNELGTAYGDQINFATTNVVSPGQTVPVVGTLTPAITGGSTASSGGFVSMDGGSTVSVRGVCWSTNINPTLADNCSVDGGSGLGFFSSTITGLSGCGTTFYVKAYATNDTGTGYGNQQTVSTGLIPVVATDDVINVNYYAAVSGGAITDNGGCTITQKGVCWSYKPNPMINGAHTSEGAGSDAFVSNITGLAANNTYYVRAYATNSVGTTYGPEKVFTTATPSTLYIGQNYAGGLIFYLDGTGLHGLVGASADQGKYAWGCQDTSIGGTDTALGTGATNTAAILAKCSESNIAAKICNDLILNDYDDWFLPSKDELFLMLTNLATQGLGGFDEEGGSNGQRTYWSSSEFDTSYAWLYFYAYYNQLWTSYSDKWEQYGPKRNVRPVRVF